MLDDIDHRILRLANERKGYPVSISDLVRPIKSLANQNLNIRVHKLADQGLLKLNKQRHYVLVKITKEGQMKAQTPKEV